MNYLHVCFADCPTKTNLQDTSASEVHLQSLKALADVAHGVSLAVPRGAQGYALALCLAQILELQRPSAEGAVVTLGEQLSFIITLSRKCRKKNHQG